MQNQALSVGKKNNINISGFSSRRNQFDEEKLRNHTNNYISFRVILNDKEFLKLIDLVNLTIRIKNFLGKAFSSETIGL